MILMMILSSLWALLLIDYFTPYQQLLDYIGMGYSRTLVSDRIVIEYILYFIHKMLNCSMCFSAHLFWITYLIMNNSFYGLLLCPIVFFLTFIIKEKILTIKL